VTLPAGVIAIGNKAFRQCARLKEVTLPQSMTYFGAEAFLWCGGLTKVVISDGVTAIGNKAFLGCQSLTEVMFPESVVKIGAEAFSGCTHLSEITIPKAVTAIGNEAFKDCGSLANVVISGNVTELGSNIFYGISDQAVIHAPCIPFDYFQTAEEKRAAACGFLNQPDLYQNTTGGDAYKKYVIAQRKRLLPYVFQKDLVQALAFFGANKKITVSNFETEYLESAGKSNALGCVAYLMDWRNANITDKALAKKDERELTKDPFNVSDMKKLWSYETMEDGTLMLTSYKGMETEVRVPHRIGKTPVTRLDDCVFATMTKNASYKPKKLIAALQAIQSVSIPDSVTSIGDMAFFECKGLKNVEIPDSVTSIGSKAFFGCESLTDGNGLVIVRNVLYGYYGSGGDVTIPPCVTEIVDAAFATRSNITGVEIPDSVTSIGKSAFMNCSCLKNVRISKNVTCISDGVFSGCSSLTSVEIPEGVNSIGVFAFSDCRKLQNILLPGSITNLGSGAFRKCDKLADDQGFVIVKDVLYSYCGSGGDIKIPEGVRIIDNEAFYLRKKITGVVIPEGVTRIGYNAFSGCTNLTYVVIPGSVTDISFSVFGYANQPQIRAPRGSYAEAYAKEGHYPFVAE